MSNTTPHPDPTSPGQNSLHDSARSKAKAVLNVAEAGLTSSANGSVATSIAAAISAGIGLGRDGSGHDPKGSTRSSWKPDLLASRQSEDENDDRRRRSHLRNVAVAHHCLLAVGLTGGTRKPAWVAGSGIGRSYPSSSAAWLPQLRAGAASRAAGSRHTSVACSVGGRHATHDPCPSRSTAGSLAARRPGGDFVRVAVQIVDLVASATSCNVLCGVFGLMAFLLVAFGLVLVGVGFSIWVGTRLGPGVGLIAALLGLVLVGTNSECRGADLRDGGRIVPRQFRPPRLGHSRPGAGSLARYVTHSRGSNSKAPMRKASGT